MRGKASLALSMVLLTAIPALSSEISDQFAQAVEKRDRTGIEAIIEKNRQNIPAEIKSILEEAAKAAPGEREGRYFLAEEMAVAYKDATGDAAPLKEAKKKSFDSRLSTPVRLEAKDGVYTIELPKADHSSKNLFKPDNIIIKTGGTVRWVNNDETAHVFSSMPLIGLGGLFTPNIEPGASWEYKFEKPGEYYYICFIHRAMIGKITVEQ